MNTAPVYSPMVMALRDHFAGMAMQGWLASFSPSEDFPVEGADQLAAFAYAIADAMVRAREVSHG